MSYQVYLQYWEESERGQGIKPDGCSLHYDIDSHQRYIKEIYKDRDIKSIPDSYIRVVGDLVISANINEEIYKLVLFDGTLKLAEYEMNNLLKLGELYL